MPRGRLFLRVALLLSCLAYFAYLGLRASPHLREVPLLPEWLAFWADGHGVMRNAVGFFGLGLVVFFLFGLSWRIAAALSLFGTGLEIAQLWIPTRQFDWRDIATSIIGVLLAWTCAGGIARLFRAWRH